MHGTPCLHPPLSQIFDSSNLKRIYISRLFSVSVEYDVRMKIRRKEALQIRLNNIKGYVLVYVFDALFKKFFSEPSF